MLFHKFPPSLRFPLFGGWKTHYFIGYNVPSYEYLFSAGEKYALNMRLIDHIFDDMLVEDMTLRVILPEGAKVRECSNIHITLFINFGGDCFIVR